MSTEIDELVTGSNNTEISRRRFGAMALGALGTAGVVATGVVVLVDGDGGGAALRSFDVEHSTDVYVTMTNGTEFVVTVKDAGTKAVLEQHTGVTARTLTSLRSDYVKIIKTS